MKTQVANIFKSKTEQKRKDYINKSLIHLINLKQNKT